MFFDAHNHLQDERFAGRHAEILADCRGAGVAKMVVNGACETDWPLVARLATEFPEVVIPSFGCHPWYLDELTSDWKETQIRWLDETPGAVIGEIGIDRWMLENPDRWRAYLGAATASVGSDREPTPMPDQEAVFIWQLKLAAERGLPVSIHCLEAFGRLLELLLEHWRPGQGFLLHSYGGPAEMVPAFAKLGGYFGFPGAHLAPQKLKRREVFRVVPRDRLLVETDAPDQPLPQPAFLFSDSAGRSWNHPANLAAVYRGLAKFLDEDPAALAADVGANFERLFCT